MINYSLAMDRFARLSYEHKKEKVFAMIEAIVTKS
jgi:hypothetical protein